MLAGAYAGWAGSLPPEEVEERLRLALRMADQLPMPVWVLSSFRRLRQAGGTVPFRSLPERTVDAWVAVAICQRFPSALLWGPTQRAEDPNWDYGASLGDGKLFILENKATDPKYVVRPTAMDTHRIRIDLRQLAWYCESIEPNYGVPVYYVLPRPPFAGEPTPGVVPAQTITRVSSPIGPFRRWAFVIRCNDLRNQLPSLPQKSTQVRTEDLPLKGAALLQDFLDAVGRCQTPELMKKVGPGDKATAVARDLFEAEYTDARDHYAAIREERRRLSRATAVFIPASDVPGWKQGQR